MTSQTRETAAHGAADYDVIVIGSGVAGLTAAVVAASERQRVLLLEKADRVGGTSAVSGGMVWIPANHLMADAGRPDSIEEARTYLDATVPPGLDPAIRETFLTRGDEAVRYVENNTEVTFQPVVTYPDYYPDRPGAKLGARVLESVPFDGRELGDWFDRLRWPLKDFMLLGGMMVSRADIPHWRKFAKSLTSARKVVGLVMRYAVQRLRHARGTTLYLGNALVGRLLLSARKAGVELRTNTEVFSLVMDGTAVAGVNVRAKDGLTEIRARKGVILATGGFSHDAELRARHLPKALGNATANVGTASLTAGARLATAVGAAIAPSAGGGFWVPASAYVDENGVRKYFPHTVTDRGKPGLIAVNQAGVRFTNEARSYHEFVSAQIAAGPVATPAWLVCDSAFLWKYGLGRVKPFNLRPKGYIQQGYLKSGATLDELAREIGVPPAAFAETVKVFNADAIKGEDSQFGRGGDAYQRHLGDADCKPNPCVAPILAGPFYAVEVHPADLGTAAGLATDKDARVLDGNGSAIPGLYACGNDMASVMNGAYPGPGITLGPALVFGYVAAQDCSRRNT